MGPLIHHQVRDFERRWGRKRQRGTGVGRCDVMYCAITGNGVAQSEGAADIGLNRETPGGIETWHD